MLAVLLPSAVKFNHVFTHHSHNVCDEDDSTNTHFHETDFDCDFYKFKLSNNLYLVFNNFELDVKKTNAQQLSSYYNFSTNYKPLNRFLRGPPLAV